MPSKILQSETIYQGRAFSVERVLTQLPDGKERNYDLVRHSGAVTIIPVDAQGRILLVRQFRVGANQKMLELPAGLIEPGEDPVECAARETREETGMAAGSLVKIGEFFMAPGYSSEFLHIFLARDLSHAPLKPDADEFLELETIPVSEVYQMAQSGQIADGKTLAALLLARSHL